MTTTESAKTLTMYQLIWLSLFLRHDAAVRFRHADLVRHAADRGQRRRQSARPVLVDRAIHLRPTSAVVPFQYLSLIWAMLFGFAVWGDVPTIGLIIGSVIVVGSGLFLLWHESRPKLPRWAAVNEQWPGLSARPWSAPRAIRTLFSRGSSRSAFLPIDLLEVVALEVAAHALVV
jgi:hypothetical protein